MSLLFIAPKRNMSSWKEAVKKADSNVDVEIWPDVKNKEQVQFAVCWNHPKHVLDQYPNLKAVSSLGAGVDHLLSDESLPEAVEICRIVSRSLVQQMKEYVLAAVLSIQRNFLQYIQQKDQGEWQDHHHPLADDVHIGVMGLGELGKPAAEQLAQMGYRVSGWSRSKKEMDGVNCFADNDELEPFLNNTQILICLLPLTSKTEGILNLDLLKKLKQPAWILNAARGEHLVDEDLIYALDSNILQGAWLDVFTEEPLPERHPFWNRPNIIITPHIAGITQPGEVVPQLVDNYKRALSGMELLYKVDREKGY
jgi:glyoxylate/hydroxypyruvate reductase A